MECVLCIKRRYMAFNENGEPTRKFNLSVDCVCGEVEAPQISVFEGSNNIDFYGFDGVAGWFDKITTYKIVDKREQEYTRVYVRADGERREQRKEECVFSYVESITLNGVKVFDINDCRGLLKCD